MEALGPPSLCPAAQNQNPSLRAIPRGAKWPCPQARRGRGGAGRRRPGLGGAAPGRGGWDLQRVLAPPVTHQTHSPLHTKVVLRPGLVPGGQHALPSGFDLRITNIAYAASRRQPIVQVTSLTKLAFDPQLCTNVVFFK